MRNTVVVDSGPLIALFYRDDVWHELVVTFLRDHPRLRLLATWAVLHETSALLGLRVGKQAELDFLAWVDRGGLTIASQEASTIRGIRALVESTGTCHSISRMPAWLSLLRNWVSSRC